MKALPQKIQDQTTQMRPFKFHRLPKKLVPYIQSRKELFWYNPHPESASLESAVEHFLNFGTWEDVQFLIQQLGWKRIVEVFVAVRDHPRSNLLPLAKSFFTMYFERHAPESTN